MAGETCTWCGDVATHMVCVIPVRRGKNYRPAVSEPACPAHQESFALQGADTWRLGDLPPRKARVA